MPDSQWATLPLTANRDRLENEQTRLIQAHYADAIPLSLLKREQDRILTELDHITRRIDAHHGEYTEARAHLDDALNLLENCVDIYKRCDDANRRLCNQAFFTKIYVDEDDDLHVEYARPYEMLLDPEINDTSSPGPRTPTMPEPQPTIVLARVRALCAGWTGADSNHMSGSGSNGWKPCGNWRSQVSGRRVAWLIPDSSGW